MTRGIKRLIDLTVASLVLILFAPVMALVALAIRLMMGRPVFFRHPGRGSGRGLSRYTSSARCGRLTGRRLGRCRMPSD